MVQWVIGLIPHGGPIELCLVRSLVYRVSAHGAIGHRIDPSWWTH